MVFVNFADQRLYSFAPGGDAPRPLTPLSAVGGGLRWIEPDPRPEHGEVWCVLEEFTGEGPTDLRRVLAAVPLDGSAADDRDAVRELTAERHRFVTGPRVSPDGSRAAWLAWDHPRMPWDGTELIVADIGPEGTFRDARAVAGGPEESIAQADWAPDGSLLYASDRTGWWNLYRDGRPLHAREEEFGGPLWKLGQRWFAPLDSGLIAVLHGRGAAVLGVLDPETGEVVDAAGPWTEFAPALAAHGERIAGVGAGAHSGFEVVELDARTGRARVIGAPYEDATDPAYYPPSRIRTFTGPGGRDIHAHLHPPHHPGCRAPDGELPPYVVWAHGGPTSRSPLVLDLEIAYFTSRGIGVAEVNYGGSSGYGREYRNRLRGQWGVVDVEDCLRRDQLPGPRPGRLGRGGDPRLRVPVPGEPDRPPRRGPGPLHRALARRARRERHRPLPAAPGAGRRDLPARAVRAVPRPHGGPRSAARLPHLRGRGARLPPGGDHGARPGGRTLPLRPGLRIHPAGRGGPGTDPMSRVAELVRPARLAPGARVAVVAPSGPVPEERLREGLDVLRGWDLDPVVAPHVLDRHGTFDYLAGTDADRAADLQAAWCDPAVDAVLCARGGYGVQRITDLLDWEAMRAAGPKVFVGFSDITALHEAFATRLGLVTLHGPMAAGLDFVKNARARDHLRATLFAPETVRVIASGGTPLVPGRATGVTLGGCLSLLAAELGTPHARPSARGGLLCLEDAGGRGGGAVPRRPLPHPAAAGRPARRGRRRAARLLAGLRALRAAAAPAGRPARRPRRAGRRGVRVRALRGGADRAVRRAGGTRRRRGHLDAGAARPALTGCARPCRARAAPAS